MHLPFASTWSTPETPPGNPREPRGNGIVLACLFLAAWEGSRLVLEKISLDHGDIPTGFVRGSAT